ncbi:MAG: hypothetical protein IAE82_07705 [Opitutaceae bacterium]|nr:hypothetical protein [Opitutaceae bacterium]
MSGSPASFRPQALISFVFFALGLASFGVALGWLAARPATFLGAARAGEMVALVHLTILGWMGSFVFGAAYQLIPVISEGPLFSRALAWVHAAMHATALPVLLGSMVHERFAGAAHAGSLLAAGAVIGVVNLAVTASRRSRWTPDNVGLQLALFWLLATVVMGVLLAFARSGNLPGLDATAVLHLHMTCGVVGFFTGTLVSVAFKLVPMFLLSAVKTPARAWASIILLNAGLVLAVPGLLGRFDGVVALAAVAIVAGIGVFLVEMVVLVRRRMRALDWPLRGFFAGVTMLLPAALAGLVGVLHSAGWIAWAPVRPGLTVFVLGVFGVLTPCILGMAGRIVPFLAWQWRYAPHVGRARVPLVADLVRVPVLRVQFVALVAGLFAVVLGVAIESPVALRMGAIAFLAGSVCLAITGVGLIPHLVHPRLAPLGAPKALPRSVSA